MHVIEARNPHSALPIALSLLRRKGVRRGSRNGAVLVMPCPVTTVYTHPLERVVFWADRDANPFFHLYEALWMLAGRNDIAPLARYAANMANYSDDGVTQWGAYGHRARHAGYAQSVDQFDIIARRLREDPEDRRSVLALWDVDRDLDRVGKDVPCNTIATFQRDSDGKLDMTVFQRSADIIWGVYGANCVHFGFILEYLALKIGCPVGRFNHVSVNWHAYVDSEAYKRVEMLGDFDGLYSCPATPIVDPYERGTVRSFGMGNIADLDHSIASVLSAADLGFAPAPVTSQFFIVAGAMFAAHNAWKNSPAPERYDKALEILADAPEQSDWAVAAKQWLLRRRHIWESRIGVANV